MPDQVGHDVCVGMTYDCWGSPVKPGMTCGSGMTMLLADAVCVIYCLIVFYGISVQVGNVP